MWDIAGKLFADTRDRDRLVEQHLASVASRLVANNAVRVERVAEALLEKTELSVDDLASLLIDEYRSSRAGLGNHLER